MNITLTTKADKNVIVIDDLTIPDPEQPIIEEILERNERRNSSDNSKSGEKVCS